MQKLLSGTRFNITNKKLFAKKRQINLIKI